MVIIKWHVHNRAVFAARISVLLYAPINLLVIVGTKLLKAIVVAVDKNNGIGADNDLLWIRDLPADLAHFKKLTTGGSIIMGRKTFETLAGRCRTRKHCRFTNANWCSKEC